MRLKVIISSLCILLLSSQLLAQTDALFSADSKSGCVPLVVGFTDQSSGSPTSWFWDFGNGNTSTKQNPNASFVTPGIYTISLKVSNGTQSDSLIKSAYISVFANPIGDFSVDTNKGCTPFTASFIDQSVPVSSVITQWFWDFGDGVVSSSQNPEHTYNLAGSYTVTILIKDGNDCKGFYFKNNSITVNSPDASFNIPPVLCNDPMEVNPVSNNSGTSITYYWDFGDGYTDTTKNPTHTYSSVGTYKVMLTLTENVICIDTSSRMVYADDPIQNFSFKATTDCDSSLRVNLTETSYPKPESVTWFFGDNKSSTEMNPTHDYNTIMNFDVTLITDFGGGCVDTLTKNIYRMPTCDLVADTNGSCKNPLTVTFTNLFIDSTVFSYSLYFDDSNSIAEFKASTAIFTFDSTGVYYVRLDGENKYGCKTSDIEQINIVPANSNFGVGGTNVVPLIDTLGTFIGYGGCKPIILNFKSEGNAEDSTIYWFWDFGDGDTAQTKDATHTYDKFGFFDITHTTINALGCTSTVFYEDYVAPGIKPDYIDFIIPKDTICHHSTHQFMDTTHFPLDSIEANFWCWHFHYSHYGYLDNLTDTGTLFYSTYYNCPAKGEEKFDVHHTTAIIPNALHDFDHYLWDRSDTVLVQSDTMMILSTYDYFGPGDTIRFISGYNGCYDTLTKPIYKLPPVAMPGYYVPTYKYQRKSTGKYYYRTRYLGECSAPQTFGLYNSSVRWDGFKYFTMEHRQSGKLFPLNATDTTFYTFNAAGNYDITISVSNDTTGCTDARSRMITLDSVIAGFTTTPKIDCYGGNAFSFNDTSISYFGSRYLWNWSFGDSTSLINVEYTEEKYIYYKGSDIIPENLSHDGRTFGTFEAPIHIYPDTGTYAIELDLTVRVPYLLNSATNYDYSWCDYYMYDTIRLTGVKAVFQPDSSFYCGNTPYSFMSKSYSTSTIISHEWDFGDGTPVETTPNPVHTYTAAGTYDIRLIVNDDIGCVDTLLSPDKIVTLSFPDFTVDETYFCEGGQAEFTNTTPDSKYLNFLWDYGDGGTDAVPDTTHNFLNYGIHDVSLTAIDTNACNFTKVYPGLISVLKNPTCAFSTDTLNGDCPPVPITFIDSSIGSVECWFWWFGDSQASIIQNPYHIYTYSDTFDVQLAVRDSFGCKDTLLKPKYIRVSGPHGTFDFSPDTGCYPFAVNFNAKVVDTDYMIWGLGDGTVDFFEDVQSGDSLSHEYSYSGTFSPSLILKDLNECVFIIPQKKYLVVEKITASFSNPDDALCTLDSVTFNEAVNSLLFVNLLWDFGDSLTDSISNPMHYYSNYGSYLVRLTISNNFDSACTITVIDTIDLIRPPVINVKPSGSSGCIPLTIDLQYSSVSTNNPVSSWEWIFSDNTTDTGKVVYHTFQNAGTDTVHVISYYKDGFCSKDTFIVINGLGWPQADFSYNPREPSIQDAAIQFLDQSVSAERWQWDFGTGDTSNAKDPEYIYPNNGTYKVRLIVFSNEVCADTVIRDVYISPSDLIEVPNVFSPNADGRNDVLYLINIGIAELLDFRIYNYWGELLFETTDMKEGWDGTYKGKAQASATYVYYITVQPTHSEKPMFMKGNFTLIR